MGTSRPKLLVFDLDGTLAVSKSPIDAEMAGLLADLLRHVSVSVISGGMWSQFEKQLVNSLLPEAPRDRLFLFPTSGACFYRFQGNTWVPIYREEFSPAEKQDIFSAFETALRDGGYEAPPRLWGDIIEDRGTQVTFSALGQAAPADEKRQWDPNTTKRKKISAVLKQLLPNFSVRLGGMTSIDVTRRGIDKGYGIAQMEKHLAVPRSEMLFVGDAIFPGGNDFAAIEAGVGTVRAVSGPVDTKGVIRDLLTKV